MTIDIALVVVALVTVVFAAWRVMTRKPTVVQDEAPLLPQRPRPTHFALPPVTIDTTPIKFIAPPIDHRVLAALVASGSRTPAKVARPQQLPRGSNPGYGAAPDLGVAAPDLDVETLTNHNDLDGAETLRPASDLDDDAETRTTMSPVR